MQLPVSDLINWHPVSYHFKVIAAYCSNFGHSAFSSHPWGFRSGRPPPIIFTRIVRPLNALQLSLTAFKHRNFVADFLQAKCDFILKFAVLRFWAPLGDLGATYDDHLRLIGKRIGLPISVNWTFFARMRRYERISVQNRRFRSNGGGAVYPKFQVEGAHPHQPSNHFSQKIRLNSLYSIKIWTDFSSVLSQSTCLTDRQTDGQTD